MISYKELTLFIISNCALTNKINMIISDVDDSNKWISKNILETIISSPEKKHENVQTLSYTNMSSSSSAFLSH